LKGAPLGVDDIASTDLAVRDKFSLKHGNNFKETRFLRVE